MHGMRFKVLNYADYSSTWCSQSAFWCFSLNYTAGEGICPGDVGSGDPGNKDMADGAHWGCKYNEKIHKASQFDLSRLMEKDMISMWRRSWAVIRIENVNPGYWMFHCHMEQHIPTGQMMVLALKQSQIGEIPEDVPREGDCPVLQHKEVLV